tara:strand:+ start:834 stop:1475 length:642 start_codon:yes stop_codon:yes gene_type:complete
MKRFTKILLAVIFVALTACSVQSISADHLEPGPGIFVSADDVELVTAHGWDDTIRGEDSTQYTNYQVHLQTVLRNADDQIINVTETAYTGAYIPHKITDYVFDTLMGEKEIITINNIKYEKVQYVFSPTLEQRITGMYPIFSDITFKYKMAEDDDGKTHEKLRDYSLWKIHYCTTFEGHGFRCVPVFQVLVPTTTLEADDVVTQQWTILRELN